MEKPPQWSGVRDNFLDVYLGMLRMEKEFGHQMDEYSYLTSLSLAASHINALIIISLRETVNMSRLAAELSCSRQHTTIVVEYLVENGLVRRRHPPENRRMIQLELTELGRCVVKQLDDIIFHMFTVDRSRSEEYARAISAVKDLVIK